MWKMNGEQKVKRVLREIHIGWRSQETAAKWTKKVSESLRLGRLASVGLFHAARTTILVKERAALFLTKPPEV